VDVFKFREHLVGDYAGFSRSFTGLRSDDIREFVDREYGSQRYGRRALQRVELDAYYARLYGLTRDALRCATSSTPRT
jgi:hypothetical protein